MSHWKFWKDIWIHNDKRERGREKEKDEGALLSEECHLLNEKGLMELVSTTTYNSQHKT